MQWSNGANIFTFTSWRKLEFHNLPVFQVSNECDAYAWVEAVQNPTKIYLNSSLVGQISTCDEADEIIPLVFLCSSIICHEIAHILVRSNGNLCSPACITREGHSGYFIEDSLNGGKIAQIRDGSGNCTGLVIRGLRSSQDNSSIPPPQYTKRFSKEMLLEWYRNLDEPGTHKLDLDDLKEFDIADLEPGEYIERSEEDDPDFVPAVSEHMYFLLPGEHIEEWTCGISK
jgi:hypothetical protein